MPIPQSPINILHKVIPTNHYLTSFDHFCRSHKIYNLCPPYPKDDAYLIERELAMQEQKPLLLGHLSDSGGPKKVFFMIECILSKRQNKRLFSNNFLHMISKNQLPLSGYNCICWVVYVYLHFYDFIVLTMGICILLLSDVSLK